MQMRRKLRNSQSLPVHVNFIICFAFLYCKDVNGALKIEYCNVGGVNHVIL